MFGGDELTIGLRGASEDVREEEWDGCTSTTWGEKRTVDVRQGCVVTVEIPFVPEWIPKSPGPGVTLRETLGWEPLLRQVKRRPNKKHVKIKFGKSAQKNMRMEMDFFLKTFFCCSNKAGMQNIKSQAEGVDSHVVGLPWAWATTIARGIWKGRSTGLHAEAPSQQP